MYEKKTWASQEIITHDALNHMEDGIASIDTAAVRSLNGTLYPDTSGNVDLIVAGSPFGYNHFDNGYFKRLVNQTGTMIYTLEDITYLCDRWRLVNAPEDLTATASASGLLLSSSETTVTLAQTFDVADLDITEAHTWVVYYSDGTVSHGTASISDNTDADGVEYYMVQVTVQSNKAIAGVALYSGSYDATTLPALTPKPYGAELVACQRWFIRWDRYNGHAVMRGYEENGRTQLCFNAPGMRGTARVAQVDGSCTVYCSSATAIIAAGSPIVCGTRTAEVINGLFVLTNSTALNGTNHYPVTMILSLDAAIDFTADFSDTIQTVADD